MMPKPEVLLFWLILIVAGYLCIRHGKHLKRADRFIALFLAVVFCVEVAAVALTQAQKSNTLLYEIYSPVELLLICLYFDTALRLFKRYHIAAFVGVLSLCVSLGATFLFHTETWVGEYFLLYEATVIIIFCLLALYEILMDEERMPYRFANFWITVCLLIFWSLTFTGWGILPVIHKTEKQLAHVLLMVLHGINYLFYTGLALVFLRYKKLIPSGA